MKKKKIKNYERYALLNEHSYNRRSLSYYLLRRPGDKYIFPYINKIKDKGILEVGAGYGYYTLRMKKENAVEVADINIELCKKIGVPTYCCSADNLSQEIDKKYEYVMSFWMTEYLDKVELRKFLIEGFKLLEPEGILLTTIIQNKGIGWLYTFCARLKGIQKYSYSIREIQEMTNEFGKVKLTKVRTVFGIPFCLIVEIQKEK